MTATKAALISVSDKTGVVDFAKNLTSLGYKILSSSGTAKYLKEGGVEVELIEDYTGQVEILGGRVKTLHPKVHAGILFKRGEEQQLEDLASLEAYDIRVVAVNLYPFIQNLNSEAAADPMKMVELIDIGGPCMLRAAAKNFKHVYSVMDPSDYPQIIESIKAGEDQGIECRQNLAVKVFSELANYNLAIGKYFSDGDVDGWVLDRVQSLRYGENPHQTAVFYQERQTAELPWKQLAGKDLSYNNLLDFDAAINAAARIRTSDFVAVIMKHLNPCGAAISGNQLEALRLAKKSDPRSHFGGIIALNKEVTADTAEEVIKDFAEIVVAPSFNSEALDILKTKKNLRIIELDYAKLPQQEVRSAAGGVLLQDVDVKLSAAKEAEPQTDRSISDSEFADLDFAWCLCQSVKSNAIVIVKDSMLKAAGAGQMSRVDSVELALHKADTHGHNLEGAVVASDAFFPFPDSIEQLAAAGIKAIISPAGSRKDAEIVEAAKQHGLSLLFAEDRHFKH